MARRRAPPAAAARPLASTSTSSRPPRTSAPARSALGDALAARRAACARRAPRRRRRSSRTTSSASIASSAATSPAWAAATIAVEQAAGARPRPPTAPRAVEPRARGAASWRALASSISSTVGDLAVGVVERLAQHVRRALGRRELLQQHQHRRPPAPRRSPRRAAGPRPCPPARAATARCTSRAAPARTAAALIASRVVAWPGTPPVSRTAARSVPCQRSHASCTTSSASAAAEHPVGDAEQPRPHRLELGRVVLGDGGHRDRWYESLR